MAKKILVLTALLCISMILACGCTGSAKTTSTEKNYGTLMLDVCVIEPENADIWSTNYVNLWNSPGGLTADDQKILAKLPACDGITVTIIDIYDDDGYVYYKIKYGDKQGWVSKLIMTGEE